MNSTFNCKFGNYKQQISEAKDFPMTITCPTNDIEKVAMALRHFIKKEKMPLTIKKKLGYLAVREIGRGEQNNG